MADEFTADAVRDLDDDAGRDEDMGDPHGRCGRSGPVSTRAVAEPSFDVLRQHVHSFAHPETALAGHPLVFCDRLPVRGAGFSGFEVGTRKGGRDEEYFGRYNIKRE